MNPVEEQLMELQALWQSFLADPTRRLLIWHVPDNARRVVQGFFEANRPQSPLQTPYVGTDSFVVFDAPFEHSIRYAQTLKTALCEAVPLEPPCEADAAPDSATGWVQALNARAHHQAERGHLVAVLLPAAMADSQAWQAWVQRALQAGPGPYVRLVVLDSPDTPVLTALPADARVHTQTVSIDAWGLARDTFAGESTNGAGGVFRLLLTGLFGLVHSGSADQVMSKAQDALRMARQQGWPDQEVVVRMLAASAMFKARRFDDAVVHYQHARSAAEQVAHSQHPAGRQLLLQTWFGEAGIHLAVDRLDAATVCYVQAE